MWHIFISNRPGHVRPGTLGTVVPGFEVKVCDDTGRELPTGEVGACGGAAARARSGTGRRWGKRNRGFLGGGNSRAARVRRAAAGYFTSSARAAALPRGSAK